MKDALIISGGSGKNSRTIALAGTLSRELTLWTIYLGAGEPIPLLNSELSAEKNFPEIINFIVEKIRDHKTIILVFPQYNYNFSAFFKNVLDWCSLKKRKIFSSKRIILIGVSQTELGVQNFQQIVSLTCSALGGEEIIFFNTTPSTNFSQLVKQIKRYV